MVCRAGTCPVCMVMVQDIVAHRCAIQQVLTLDLMHTWARLRDNMHRHSSCQACGTTHFLKKNIHGFRTFFGVALCWNCYSIPEISEHVTTTRLKLLGLDAHAGKWKCALCTTSLFDPTTLQSLEAFERDHLDVFTKTASVWELLVSGAPFEKIKQENDKCRNLCVRCHSAVTCAERAVGILRLKSLDRTQSGLPLYTKQRALYQVETLTRMLLETDPP
jgi:hypothetical protein